MSKDKPAKCGECGFFRTEWKFLKKPRCVCRHSMIGEAVVHVDPSTQPEFCPLKRDDVYEI